MTYRNDRDAWRQRAEQLEHELSLAKRKLQQPTEQGALHGDAPRGVVPARASRVSNWLVLGVLTLISILGALAFMPAFGAEATIVPAVAVLAILLACLYALARVVEVVPPNRALVLSGRKVRRADGDIVGYRIVRGGRAVRIPVLEHASELELGLHRVEVGVRGMFTKGGIPVDVDLVAWVAIADASPGLDKAAERFLDVPRDAVGSVARQTLEGALRALAAELKPEWLLEGRAELSARLLSAAAEDMQKLGLHVESVCFLSIRDEAGYLAGLGRERIANVLRAAELRSAGGG